MHDKGEIVWVHRGLFQNINISSRPKVMGQTSAYSDCFTTNRTGNDTQQKRPWEYQHYLNLWRRTEPLSFDQQQVTLLTEIFILTVMKEIKRRYYILHSHLIASWFCCSADLLPWSWRWYFPPKHWFVCGLHGTISKKMATFINWIW
jgi:hypothetical protein